METFYTILNDEDDKINQPETIKIPLMNHQKTMISKMIDIETNGKIIKKDIVNLHRIISLTFTGKIKSSEISTNIGILGDKVGAGKTLMIISLISQNKELKDRDLEIGGNAFYSLKIKLENINLKTNLVIVPHKLIPQWTDSFIKYSTNLAVYSIMTNKDIDKIVKTYAEVKKNWKKEDYIHNTEVLDHEKVNRLYDVIIIGDTMFRRFNDLIKDVKWTRVFVDEIDSIPLPRNINIKFNFLWLITGTPSGISKKGKNSLLGDLFERYNENYSKYFVIKNKDDYIDSSIKLPHPHRYKILCLSPRELTVIQNIIPNSILQMINAGNSEEAIKTLNCNVDTNDNIFQVITKDLKDKIKNKEKELNLEKDRLEFEILNYNNHDREANVKIIEQSLTKLNNKYDDIRQKIYELNNEYCPICMDEFNNPVIVGCCNNCFCFDCLAVSLAELHNNKCPFCRQPVMPSDMHLISNEEKLLNPKVIVEKKEELKKKMDVLLDLIKSKPDGSFMIFANYHETFYKIKNELSANNISYHILMGQATTVNYYIEDFKEKKVRVLMLNARFFGAGMNLQMTTDLVIYHRFNEEMEEQIIGRAQRFGRATPLNVYYLLHDNESNNIQNKFKFEEKDYNIDNLINNLNINEKTLNEPIVDDEHDIKEEDIIIKEDNIVIKEDNNISIINDTTNNFSTDCINERIISYDYNEIDLSSFKIIE
jgi:hypothetical protein